MVGFGNVHEHELIERTSKDDLDAFLAKVTRATRHLIKTECPERLIVAGDRDVRSEFARLAPDSIQKSIIGSIPIPIRASAQQILQLTTPIARFAEREFETKQVDELIRLAKHQKKVTVGLNSTLEVLNAGRVGRLLYCENLNVSGKRCELCDGLFVESADICPRCNVATRPVSDLIAAIVSRALHSDASIEQVRGGAAFRLKEVGSIGAFLRY
jgi:hypothetical protein